MLTKQQKNDYLLKRKPIGEGKLDLDCLFCVEDFDPTEHEGHCKLGLNQCQDCPYFHMDEEIVEWTLFAWEQYPDYYA
ncbi:hypothetical protein [Lyngbya sp. CCY1209]|uniref:hypothetical protein n=1 Tax=Lyngbya sp. CCY1209 TaxID=2886103 RepID=UPI002D20197B|nr:hypothetical protein [Lyngbya sp. CCY1209]MEB3884040.1 hypothetical protein [Lyngbya sp. CCY1209]